MLLSLEGVSFGYDDKTILKDVTVTINEGDRIGLIGVNGAGKTTLLNVIAGDIEPDGGSINRKSGLNIGYLRQNGGLVSFNTVYKEMESVFSYLKDIENKIRDVEKKMSSIAHGSDEYKTLTCEYDRLVGIFEAKEGYDVEVKIKRVLSGMGFENDHDKEISVMSGGERTRLALAKLLLCEPDILILDEPTNHLDLATVAWLEKYLSSYKGSILTVSHDRYFLDRTVNAIWDLENNKITHYKGNYTKFKNLKNAKIEYESKEYERQQLKMKAMREYAEKNIVRATTSKSARSRLNQLENMDVIEKPYIERRQAKFRFEYDYESVKETLKVKNASVNIDGTRLVDGIDFMLLRGEKLAIVGDNGTGKSTFLRTLMGMRKDEGTVEWGKNTRLAYYDQDNATLDFNNTVLDEYFSAYRDKTLTETRSDLARMLLTGDDMGKKVSSLSGGERAKLSFAMMMALKGNTLIFDEPTNHIDLTTREELENALRSFGGSIIFVSHDRYFIDSICTKVLEFSGGRANIYNGGYQSYLSEKANIAERAAREKVITKKAKGENTYRNAKMRSEEAKLRNELKSVEKEIESLETRSEEISSLISGEKDYTVIMGLSGELEDIRVKLEVLYSKWEELAEKLS